MFTVYSCIAILLIEVSFFSLLLSGPSVLSVVYAAFSFSPLFSSDVTP
jgi:hypothetical protein